MRAVSHVIHYGYREGTSRGAQHCEAANILSRKGPKIECMEFHKELF